MSIASRRLVLQGALFGVACACLATRTAFAAETPAPNPSGKWVCPPCGCSADGDVFNAPGDCPACGMKLIPKPADAPAPPKARDGADAGFVAVSNRRQATGWRAGTRT